MAGPTSGSEPPGINEWFNITSAMRSQYPFPYTEVPPLFGASMVVDQQGGVAYDGDCALMFGGYAPWGPVNYTFIGVWTSYETPSGTEYPGIVWYNATSLLDQVAQGHKAPWAPPPLYYASMAYDPVDEEVVLFGGQNGTGGGVLGGTWTTSVSCSAFGARGISVNVNLWTQLHDQVSPSPRSGAEMAFDSIDNYVVLFGGSTAPPSFEGTTWTPPPTFSDTWSFVGGKWTQLHPLTSPPADAYGALVNNSAGVLLITGWGLSVEEWTFQGGNWAELTSSNPTGFGYRFLASVTDAPYSGNITAFGGLNESSALDLGDTWNLTPTTDVWSNPIPVGAPTPSVRFGAAMAFDPAIGLTVLFGGRSEGGSEAPEGFTLNDTWLFGSWSPSEVPFSVALAATPQRLLGPGLVQLTATLDGGTPPYSEDWSFGDAGPVYPVSPAPVTEVLDHTYNLGALTTYGNFWVSVTVEDANDLIANANLTLTVAPTNSSIVSNWQPGRDTYSFGNPGSPFEPGGECYGISSTEILYWENDIEGYPGYPELPAIAGLNGQDRHVWDSNELQVWGGTLNNSVLNGTSLAIFIHQAWDPENYDPIGSFSTLTEPKSLAEVIASVADGQPVIIQMLGQTPKGAGVQHAVVVYGVQWFPNGSYELDISDPDAQPTDPPVVGHPGTLYAWYLQAGEFTYNDGNQYYAFGGVTNPTPLQAGWFYGWGQGGINGFNNAGYNWGNWLQESSFDMSTNGFDFIASNNPGIVQQTYLSPYFGYVTYTDFFGSASDSQSFTAGIPGSAGIADGQMEVFAAPQGNDGGPTWISGSSSGGGYAPRDFGDGDSDFPSTDSSPLIVDALARVNISGAPGVEGGTVGVTTSNPSGVRVTLTAEGLNVSSGADPATLNVTLLQEVSNHTTGLLATDLAVPADSLDVFSVSNWSGLNSSSRSAATLRVVADNGTGPSVQFPLLNNQTGLGPGALVSSTATFSETGLPVGASWTVTIPGVGSYNTTGTSIIANAVNGTYAYSIAASNSSWAGPGGEFTIVGAGISISVKFHLVTYSVTFEEAGIPSDTLARFGWTVGVGDSWATGHGSTLSTSLPNGSYYALVTGPAGYTPVVNGPTSLVSISGTAVTTEVTFEKGRTGSLTVDRVGLPRAQTWCISLSGLEHCTPFGSTKFTNLTLSSSYELWVNSPLSGQAVTGRLPGGLNATLTGGYPSRVHFTLAGSSRATITFRYGYSVTFTEVGLPVGAGNASWSIVVRGATVSNASGTPIVFNLTNGTYSYKIGLVPGYQARGIPTRLGIRGLSLHVVVVFRKT